ncbi:MAG: DUF2769 domain-containing protein [Smithella sp.]
MNQAISPKVPFTASNFSKCLCPKCPVQAKSECVRGKLTTINTSLAKTSLSNEDIPGIYCSTGNATCQDIDPKQSCLCGACAVFSQYKLDKGLPAGYFCVDGFAK